MRINPGWGLSSGDSVTHTSDEGEQERAQGSAGSVTDKRKSIEKEDENYISPLRVFREHGYKKFFSLLLAWTHIKCNLEKLQNKNVLFLPNFYSHSF